MKLKNSIKKFFSRFNKSNASVASTLASKAVTSEIAGYIANLSQFQTMDDADVYENVYVWTPEVGGAIDRQSSLVRQAIKGFYIKDAGDELDEIEKEMLRVAENVGKAIKYKDMYEANSELLYIHGNIFAKKEKETSITILPNKYCNLIDSRDVINTKVERIMFDPKFLVVNEAAESELDTDVIPADKFIHIKYKDTPIMATDSLDRKTFGFYSVSPINRAILYVWWSRQIQIVDVLLRWRSIPREHHSIDSEMFNLQFYSGSPEERAAAAQRDFKSFATEYAAELADKTPDQGLITPDTVSIETVESGTPYVASNDLLEQLNSYSTTALNMPRSVIDGSDSGSYASQLVVSNYVASKVVQIAEKLTPMILDIIKARVLAENSSFPVEKLDIKIELTLAATQLEMWRQAAIMNDMEQFTSAEIRGAVSYEPLRADQIPFVTHKNSAASKTTADTLNGGGFTENPDYPTSESSKETTEYDATDNLLKQNE